MTVIADSKQRVVVPGAKPGDVFAYEDQGNGHFALVRLHRPAATQKMTRAQVHNAIKHSKLKFDMTWEQLRAWTREG